MSRAPFREGWRDSRDQCRLLKRRCGLPNRCILIVLVTTSVVAHDSVNVVQVSLSQPDQDTPTQELVHEAVGAPTEKIYWGELMKERRKELQDADEISRRDALDAVRECKKYEPRLQDDKVHSHVGANNSVRVMIADYPTTGQTWLRHLVARAVEMSNSRRDELQLPIPDCSVYDNERPFGEQTRADGDIYCRFPNATHKFIKNHFPANPNVTHYAASLRFDRLVWLVRHPVATLAAEKARGWNQQAQVDLLSCWAGFWRHVASMVSKDRVMIVRYEDLCRETANTTHNILKFMGGAYADVSLQDVVDAIKTPMNEGLVMAGPKRWHGKDLKCIHAGDLRDMNHAESKDDHEVVKAMDEFLHLWGYPHPD